MRPLYSRVLVGEKLTVKVHESPGANPSLPSFKWHVPASRLKCLMPSAPRKTMGRPDVLVPVTVIDWLVLPTPTSPKAAFGGTILIPLAARHQCRFFFRSLSLIGYWRRSQIGVRMYAG